MSRHPFLLLLASLAFLSLPPPSLAAADADSDSDADSDADMDSDEDEDTPTSAGPHGGYVSVGLGPAVSIEDWPNQMRVHEEIGYFVDGRSTGLFVAFAPSQSWGSDWWVLVFPVRIGGTFDLFRSEDFGVQLGASGSLGIGITDQFGSGRDPDAWFHVGFGVLGRVLLLDDLLALYVRPVGFEVGIGDSACCGNEAVRFTASVGAQYYFF